MAMKKKTFICWIIKLRNIDEYYAVVNNDLQAFNTFKFSSKEGAIAYARKNNMNPIDYVLVKCEFTIPKILKTEEIDYSSSSLALTK